MTEKILAELGITLERIEEKLDRIGSARILDYIKVEDGRVKLVASDELTPEQTAAIKEVSVDKEGKTFTIKLHSGEKARVILGESPSASIRIKG